MEYGNWVLVVFMANPLPTEQQCINMLLIVGPGRLMDELMIDNESVQRDRPMNISGLVVDRGVRVGRTAVDTIDEHLLTQKGRLRLRYYFILILPSHA